MDNNNVQLGCGTLIIIAIIVMVFSGANDMKELQREMEAMNQKVDRLEKKLDELSQTLSRQPAPEPATPAAR
jgi:cell division protein FtsL